MAQTAGGTYYAASSELVSSWPATSLDLANQLESRFAAKSPVSTTGLVKLNATTVAAGSTAASVNSVFTTTYARYRIIANLLGSSGTVVDLSFRFRNAGADKTGASDYGYHQIRTNGTSVTTASAVTNGGYLGQIGNYTNLVVMDLWGPAQAGTKQVDVMNGSWGTSTNTMHLTNIVYVASHACDGFSIFPQSGTFSGTITTYAYLD